jgi:translation initiation factor 1
VGAKPAPRIPDDGVVRVGCERRRGSSMTMVYGVPERDQAEIGKELRRRCGTGGTTKNGIIELQGDHRDVTLAFFAARGARTKRMGG